MCLTFSATRTEDALPPPKIVRRYNAASGENEYSISKPRKEPKPKVVAFWICQCGQRVNRQRVSCRHCGTRQKQDDGINIKMEKIEKVCEGIKKDLEDVKKDKKGCNEACKCSRCKERDNKKCENCKGHKEENCCHASEPWWPAPFPAPIPVPPVPAPVTAPAPGLPPGVFVLLPTATAPPGPPPPPARAPSPEPRNTVQRYPAVNIFIPQNHEPRHKDRSPRRRSPSISSVVSNTSFERVRHRISGLGKKVLGLEERELRRAEEIVWKRANNDMARHSFEQRRMILESREEEAARLRDEIARERARNDALLYQQAEGRARAVDRARWREREFEIRHVAQDPRCDQHHHFHHLAHPQAGRGWNGM